MRRREAAVVDSDDPPVNLTRFRYAEWADEGEPVPSGHRVTEWPTWHDIRARRRYMDARRAWCGTHGRGFAETFYPEWARWYGQET